MKTKTFHCSVCGKARRRPFDNTGYYELKGEETNIFCSIECGKKFIDETYFDTKCSICGKKLTKKYYIPGEIRYALCRDYFCSKKCGANFLNNAYRGSRGKTRDDVVLDFRVWNTKNDAKMRKDMIDSLVPFIITEEDVL